MVVYAIMTAVAVAGGLWAKISRDKLQDCLPEESRRCRRSLAAGILLSFLPLFLVSALRWNVGTDTWHTYTPEFLAMKSEKTDLSTEEQAIVFESGKLNARWDLQYTEERLGMLTYEECLTAYQKNAGHTAFGFQLLERFLIFFNADVQWLYVVTSLIILCFIYAAIWKQSGMPALALLLFVLTSSFFLSLNIVSQFMAISICVFACIYAQEQKPVPFFFLVALAACFHVSALVFLPVYIFPKLKIKPIWCAVAVGVMLILGQFAYPLIVRAVELLVPKYAWYLNKSAEFEKIFFAIGLAIFALGTWYWSKGKDKPYYRLWFYMNVIGLIALCFSGRIPNLKRINYYFAAPHFLFLPLMIQCEERPTWKKLLTAAVVLLFLAETVVAVGMMNKNGVLPYHTMIQADRPALSEELLFSIMP